MGCGSSQCRSPDMRSMAVVHLLGRLSARYDKSRAFLAQEHQAHATASDSLMSPRGYAACCWVREDWGRRVDGVLVKWKWLRRCGPSLLRSRVFAGGRPLSSAFSLPTPTPFSISLRLSLCLSARHKTHSGGSCLSLQHPSSPRTEKKRQRAPPPHFASNPYDSASRVSPTTTVPIFLSLSLFSVSAVAQAVLPATVKLLPTLLRDSQAKGSGFVVGHRQV